MVRMIDSDLIGTDLEALKVFLSVPRHTTQQNLHRRVLAGRCNCPVHGLDIVSPLRWSDRSQHLVGKSSIHLVSDFVTKMTTDVLGHLATSQPIPGRLEDDREPVHDSCSPMPWRRRSNGAVDVVAAPRECSQELRLQQRQIQHLSRTGPFIFGARNGRRERFYSEICQLDLS